MFWFKKGQKMAIYVYNISIINIKHLWKSGWYNKYRDIVLLAEKNDNLKYNMYVA